MHREAIRACPDLTLVAGFTRNPDRLSILSREWGFTPYRSAQELLDDPSIDAVVVLTPSAHHFEHVSEALKAGKHALVEKPVARHGNEIAELRRLARDRGLICMPAHCAVYRPALQHARELILGGVVGSPYFCQVTLAMPISSESMQGWRGRNALAGGGALVDSGTHRLYQIIYLMGRPAQVFAYTAHHKQPIEGEDLALLSLRFQSGALGVVLQSWISHDPTFPELKILGTEGTIELSDQLHLNGKPLFAQLPRQDSFNRMLQHFADCVRLGVVPRSTMEDAELTARTIDASYESVTTGAAVTIPLQEGELGCAEQGQCPNESVSRDHNVGSTTQREREVA
jgi:predicted dehydrogenase